MKAYRGVDPLDFLAETGKRIIYIYINTTFTEKTKHASIIINHISCKCPAQEPRNGTCNLPMACNANSNLCTSWAFADSPKRGFHGKRTAVNSCTPPVWLLYSICPSDNLTCRWRLTAALLGAVAASSSPLALQCAQAQGW